MKVGVLALQGCVDPHLAHFKTLGVEAMKVRSNEDLAQCDRLVLPGGESTTMLSLLKRQALWAPVQEFVRNKPCWGVCAGAILLAKEVINPKQESLEAIDVKALRNAYGSQLDSFHTDLEIPVLGKTLEVDFIRAPKLEALSKSVEILALFAEQPVLLKQGKILVSAFHPELGTNPALHQYFLSV